LPAVSVSNFSFFSPKTFLFQDLWTSPNFFQQFSPRI
jgi:hypothetical protein